MTRLRLILSVLALVVLVAGPSIQPAAAQEPYPSRPISLVVPFPPGGVADLTARPVAAAMEKALKQPVGVVNKTGAAGAVGMQFVATSKPDGYTLLLALSSISIIPEADKLFGRPPAFTVDQFAPVALISADPTILVVRAESPWKTAKEFIEDAKKRPNQISYSSSGIYGTLHMAMELLSHGAGIKLRHVPYAGAGPALTALLGGHVDALASGPSVVLPQIKAGKLRALAGWGDKRVASLPDLPTFKELGYPEAEFYIWAGLFAPKGTPEPVLAKLREAARAGVADPDFKSAMDKLETPIAFKQGAEFQKFFEADALRLAEGVRKVGRVEQK
ncbi:MAG: tripartite tricarboxylate transporter substrate binding protein [Candidatus Rokubacteria bacterium]|nr:tripartite tricarboxylate transporter substrate binding protein [Candidatus Rokubacteria bacterium]